MITNKSRYSQSVLYAATIKGQPRITIDTSTQVRKLTNSAITHRVIEGDTMESIAYKYYGDATYWWAIARENNLFDIDRLTIGTLLDIP